MIRIEPSFSFGIEEEYFLVDQESRDLAAELPPQLLAALETVLGKQFSTEYMRSQIEISTPVCATSHEARRALVCLRRSIAHLASLHGLAPIAAATHPFARWSRQHHTDAPRYNDIADDLQGLGRRMLINGLHVHIGIEHNDARIELMNELRQFLPLLLALSTSSPFWQGEVTGLKSYRTAVNDATPRKGIPERFAGWRDFKRTVSVLVRAGVLQDATKIWWDVRPSARFQTLEMRITDVCPLVDDTICIVALVRCLCRCLHRMSRGNAGSPIYPLLLINENRWRAQRYGIERGLIDLNGGRIVAFRDVLDDVLELIREDAEHFDCVAEVEHARTIAARGTSAERQLALYQQLSVQGLSPEATLASVVDLLIEETASDGAMPRKGTRVAEPLFGRANPFNVSSAPARLP
jgi:glutamate---cysteine ligase / carboxylate-amine ligase